MSTNATTTELNFHKYTAEQYDRDIVNSIPFHHQVHEMIKDDIRRHWTTDKPLKVLDLGAGTGLTSLAIREVLPTAHLKLMDFSEQMLAGARQKLGEELVTYITDDYATAEFEGCKFDIVVSAFGIHHQSDLGKYRLFNKIRRALDNYPGTFIFADLVTFRDPYEAAACAARHYRHLVESSADEQALKEWAHHHMFMNHLTPIEDQIDWLEEVGFTDIELEFCEFQTALIVAGF